MLKFDDISAGMHLKVTQELAEKFSNCFCANDVVRVFYAINKRSSKSSGLVIECKSGALHEIEQFMIKKNGQVFVVGLEPVIN